MKYDILIMFILILLFALFVVGRFFLFHIRLVNENMTTLENMDEER